MDTFERVIFCITLFLIGIGFIWIGNDFANLQQQINELQFEQSYIEYVKEDGERQ